MRRLSQELFKIIDKIPEIFAILPPSSGELSTNIAYVDIFSFASECIWHWSQSQCLISQRTTEITHPPPVLIEIVGL